MREEVVKVLGSSQVFGLKVAIAVMLLIVVVVTAFAPPVDAFVITGDLCIPTDTVTCPPP